MMPGHAKGPAPVCSQCLQGKVLLRVVVTCQILLCATQVIICELCIIWLLQCSKCKASPQSI